MNQEYFDIVGKNMIDSFLQYTPDDFELHVYAENITSDIPLNYKLKYYDWNITCYKDWLEFSKKTDDSKSIKFAKKGFAFLHALENINTEKLVWLDADILFLQETNKNIIDSTLPKDYMIGLFDHSYLNNKGFSAESGYVIIDTKHKSYKDFVNTYKKYYTVNSKPREIERWYDGQVCMLAASKFDKLVYNLSKLRYNDVTHTPLNDSPLNKYMIHYKGKKTKRFIKNTQ